MFEWDSISLYPSEFGACFESMQIRAASDQLPALPLFLPPLLPSRPSRSLVAPVVLSSVWPASAARSDSARQCKGAAEARRRN